MEDEVRRLREENEALRAQLQQTEALLQRYVQREQATMSAALGALPCPPLPPLPSPSASVSAALRLEPVMAEPRVDWSPRFDLGVSSDRRFHVQVLEEDPRAQSLSYCFTSAVHHTLRAAHPMTHGQYEWTCTVTRTLCQRIMLGVCTRQVPAYSAHTSAEAWLVHCESGFRWHRNERSPCISRVIQRDKLRFGMDVERGVLSVSWNGAPPVVVFHNVRAADGELFVCVGLCERHDTVRVF